jgi:hypothetical protein
MQNHAFEIIARDAPPAPNGPRWSPTARVANVSPVCGWELRTAWNAPGYPEPYIARGPAFDVLLSVSPHNFTPSQARFDWLVRSGFPTGVVGRFGAHGPLCDCSIDAAIAAERVAA